MRAATLEKFDGLDSLHRTLAVGGREVVSTPPDDRKMGRRARGLALTRRSSKSF
jgi:hypothetical protein